MMTNYKITSAVLALTTLGLVTKYGWNTFQQWKRDKQLAKDILDDLANEEYLAIENLLPGSFRQSIRPRTINVPHAENAQFESNLACVNPSTHDLGIDDIDMVNERTVLVEGLELDNTPVKERRHRRLPRTRKDKTSYLKCVIAEVKAKVGTLSDKEANRMVARRVARGLMEAHGLRPTHQQAILPLVIEGVLTPGDEELKAAAWGRSLPVRWRRAGGKTSWLSWFNPFARC